MIPAWMTLGLGFLIASGVSDPATSAESVFQIGELAALRADGEAAFQAGFQSGSSGDGTSIINRSKNLKAIGLSLLLPGLAQLEMGEKNRGIALIVAEGAIWTAFVTFRVQGEIRKDSYVEMAEIYAGVTDAESRDDDYFKQIGSWLSGDRYNRLVRRDARTVHGDDLVAREAYFEANKVPEDQDWSWESYAAFERYREKRSESQSSFKRSRNMLGLAVANRAVAMIDAVLLGQRDDGETSTHLEFRPVPGSDAFAGRLCLTRSLP